MTFKKGNIVKVKQGVLDPDFGDNIGDWQGKISDVDGDLVCIDLDNTTLSICPDKYIQRCEEDGLDWEQIYLSAENVELAIPRITPANLTNIKEAIHLKHQWDHLGKSTSKRIHEVLNNTNITDEYEVMGAWKQYFNNNLSFPFDAEISEHQAQEPLKQGDNVRIYGVVGNDEHYGVIVNVRRGEKSYECPLCIVEVKDKKSSSYRIVSDYSVWYSNR